MLIDTSGGHLREGHPLECPVIIRIAVEVSLEKVSAVRRDDVIVVGFWSSRETVSQADISKCIRCDIIRSTPEAGAVVLGWIIKIGNLLLFSRKISNHFDLERLAGEILPRQVVESRLEGIPFLTEVIPLPGVTGATRRHGLLE